MNVATHLLQNNALFIGQDLTNLHLGFDSHSHRFGLCSRNFLNSLLEHRLVWIVRFESFLQGAVSFADALVDGRSFRAVLLANYADLLALFRRQVEFTDWITAAAPSVHGRRRLFGRGSLRAQRQSREYYQ